MSWLRELEEEAGWPDKNCQSEVPSLRCVWMCDGSFSQLSGRLCRSTNWIVLDIRLCICSFKGWRRCLTGGILWVDFLTTLYAILTVMCSAPRVQWKWTESGTNFGGSVAFLGKRKKSNRVKRVFLLLGASIKGKKGSLWVSTRVVNLCKEIV